MGGMEINETTLVQEIKTYARDHYEDGGWDVILECWEDDEIADTIRGARTVRGAIRKIRRIVDVYADRQADARNSVF